MEVAGSQISICTAIAGEPVEADAVKESILAVNVNYRPLCNSGDWKAWNGAQGGGAPEVVFWPG